MDANQRFDDVLASHKVDSSLKLIVRNTFLDVEEMDDSILAQPQLHRQRTAPVLAGGRTGIELVDSESEEEEEEAVVCQRADMRYEVYGREEVQDKMTSTDLIVPAPPDLNRMKTFDAFEVAEFFPGSAELAQAPVVHDNLPFLCAQPSGDQWMSAVYLVTGQVPPPQVSVSAEPALPSSPAASTNEAPSDIESVQEWETLQEPPERFQPQTLSQWRNRTTGSTVIYWTVDAKKLRSNDRLTVSPLFKLSDGHVNAPPLPFKMTVTPKVVSDGKGGASFRMAKGRGAIQLKCEAPRDDEDMESYPIRFCLSAWSGREEHPRQLPARGPVECNFARSGICGLPKEQEYDIWDFNDVVDEASQTFVICLEVSAPGA